MCPDEDGRTPGERLRAMREAAGLSQAEAARRLGMDVGTLSRKERGQNATTTTDLLAAQVAYATVERGLGDVPGNAQSRADMRRTVEYWVGRQEASVELMQDAAAVQGQVAAMQSRAADMMAKAIAAQREIMAFTLPTPVAGTTPPDDRDEQFVADMRKARAELEARAAQEKPAAKRGRAG